MIIRPRGVALVTLVLTVMAGGVSAAPPDLPPQDRLLPPEQHQSAKGQQLAARHARALEDLNAEIYYCMPWLEVASQSIGFFRPRHTSGDIRYLSVRAYVEQEPSAQFASLTLEERAAAMFSRYAGSLLRRLGGHPAIATDHTIDGFTVILEWLKQLPTRGARPVNETIAVFVEKVDGDDFLEGRATIRDLASRARVLAWDGERAVGALRFVAWDDDFLKTYRTMQYRPPAGVTCP